MDQPLAIVLLSGGLDSTTALAWALREGFEPHALSFTYGQLHTVELRAAKRVAAQFKVQHHTVLHLPLASIGGSSLTGEGEVPKNRTEIDGTGIPNTYVPARNTIFLSYALALCEVTGAQDVVIGVSHVDYSGYPDCRPEFIGAFETLANSATALGVAGNKITIHAPLMELTKRETIELGLSLGVDYALTHTCYDPDPEGRACGTCDSCQLRLKGFAQAGRRDPAPYVEPPQ